MRTKAPLLSLLALSAAMMGGSPLPLYPRDPEPDPEPDPDLKPSTEPHALALPVEESPEARELRIQRIVADESHRALAWSPAPPHFWALGDYSAPAPDPEPWLSIAHAQDRAEAALRGRRLYLRAGGHVAVAESLVARAKKRARNGADFDTALNALIRERLTRG